MGQDRQDREDRRAWLTGGTAADDRAEIRNAVRFERMLAVKAIIPLGLVGLVIGF